MQELNQSLIAELIMEINSVAGKRDADSKLYYPDAFLATNSKNWIKKKENYLDSCTGKAGVTCWCKNLNQAPDKYTRENWAALFGTM